MTLEDGGRKAQAQPQAASAVKMGDRAAPSLGVPVMNVLSYDLADPAAWHDVLRVFMSSVSATQVIPDGIQS